MTRVAEPRPQIPTQQPAHTAAILVDYPVAKRRRVHALIGTEGEILRADTDLVRLLDHARAQGATRATLTSPTGTYTIPLPPHARSEPPNPYNTHDTTT